MFATEYEFTLPRGFVDAEGNLNREGVMRLATAADEILPQKDPRVQANPAYLTVIVLSRVIRRIGQVSNVTTHTIEGLFSADLDFLQRFYNKINAGESPVRHAVCPRCEHRFETEDAPLGEALKAIP